MAKTTIWLRKVICDAQGETGKGGDDLFIKYAVDGGTRDFRYPEGSGSGHPDTKKGDVWKVNLQIEYSSTVRIDLYDNDTFPQAGEFLGSHSYSAGDAATVQTFDTGSPNNGKYRFETGPEPAP